MKTVRLTIRDRVRLGSEYAGTNGGIVAIEERQAIHLSECEVEFEILAHLPFR